MEKLTILENKISALVQLIKTAREENAALVEKNDALEKKIAKLEHSMLGDTNLIKKLDEEQELTKTVIDDLIHSIDSLIENEHQQ